MRTASGFSAQRLHGTASTLSPFYHKYLRIMQNLELRHFPEPCHNTRVHASLGNHWLGWYERHLTVSKNDVT